MKSARSLFPVMILVVVGIACGPRIDDKMFQMAGPNDRISIVFYFKKETTNEQITHFLDYEIGVPHPEGRGSGLMKGNNGRFLVRTQGFEGYALELSPNITDEERGNILYVLGSSELVFKIFENVIPNEIVLDPNYRDSYSESNDNNKPKNIIVNKALRQY